MTQPIHDQYEFKRKELGLGTSWVCCVGSDIQMIIQHDWRISEVDCWRVHLVNVGSYRIFNDKAPYTLTFEQARQRSIKMMNMLHGILNKVA